MTIALSRFYSKTSKTMDSQLQKSRPLNLSVGIFGAAYCYKLILLSLRGFPFAVAGGGFG
jgi:hypothetical protein